MGSGILTHQQNQAFVRLHLIGESVVETADGLGLSPSTVRVLIHRARQRIRGRAERMNVVDRERYAPLLQPRAKRRRVYQLNSMDHV